ncbi:unnamed protein product [Paramecium sonneborni]|uniref:Uncharacterized protein n=1 Tax=Paramecium sonneborni TaxID=65129 RepID=A0A8S1RQT6_9CILI|nr:unnamed protein product [Paramecium sonneborni]
MDIQTENLQRDLQQTYFKQTIQEHEIEKWDDCNCQISKKTVQITFTQNQQILYLQDGAIHRKKQIHDTKNLEIFSNMDQIENLLWKGQNGLNKEKIGKWIISWYGEVLVSVGGYYEIGQKHGLWKEMIQQFQIYAQVFQVGEFQHDLRRGQWNIIYHNQKMQFIKIIQCHIQYIKGMKIGKWDTMYCRNFEKYYKQIGGGSYIQKQDGNSGKYKMWIELWEGFNDNAQVIYIGEYNIKSMKVGQWDVKYYQKYDNQYRKIGGGTYVEYQNNSSGKIGNWLDLWEGFKSTAQVIYNGDYNQQGKKIGRWNILLLDKFDYNSNSKIGGGYYEEQQDDTSVKMGMWMEFWEGFKDNAQVTYVGGYNIKGVKMERWNIWHQEKYGDDKNNQIGGGQYEEQQDGICVKVGMWIEVWEGFNDNAQVTYSGQYNLNGVKVGQWEIMYRKNEDEPFKKIGGGQYYQQRKDFSIKTGGWIEIGVYWWQTYNGDYNEQGIKIGIWKVMDISENKKFDEIIYND